MTENEWLRCRRPSPMLSSLTESPGLIYNSLAQQHPRGRRRLRLFGVAIARRVIHLVDNPKLHKLLAATEAFADGVGRLEVLERLRRQSGVNEFSGVSDDEGAERYRYLLTRNTRKSYAAQAVAILDSRDAVSCTIMHANAALALEGENLPAESAVQSDLLRDIFGNPFRPVAFDPAWRTSTTVALADGIYADRAFDRLPILADALEDAGCDSADLLAHCRGDGPHVRGCWAVDLVLDKV